MNYQEALAYVYSLSDIERSRDVTSPPPRFDLERVRRLVALVGNPQNEFASVHIAGTKGKGSVAAILDSVLRAAGYRVGRFTSPNLHHFLERITVDDEPIEETAFARITTEVRAAADEVSQRYPELGQLTTFEVTTAIALKAFAQYQVKLAILETGLGGRLDATNIVTPIVAILTAISIDHTRFLGDTLLAIAGEKAGIIKAGVAVVSSAQAPSVAELIRQTGDSLKAPLTMVGSEVHWKADAGTKFTVTGRLGSYAGLTLPLEGFYQRDNAAIAIAAAEVLMEKGYAIPPRAMQSGLATVWWPGRLETVALAPRVIVDGAHNVDSAQKLAQVLETAYRDTRLVLMIGTSSDKDVVGIVRELAPLASAVVATRSQHPRSAEIEIIASEARRYCPSVHTAPDVDTALRLARELAGSDGVVCATGSLFIVAETREAVGLKTAKERFPVPAK